MTIILATVIFPHAKSNKVAKKNIEMIKKYPSDPSISTLLGLAVKPMNEGMKVIAMSEVAKGKESQAINRLAQEYQEYVLEIEGLTYQIETYMSVAEAYKVLGMEPPEE